jgi:hypothetical protein
MRDKKKSTDPMKRPEVIVLTQLISTVRVMRKNLNPYAAEFAAKKEQEFEHELNLVIEKAA